MEMREARNITYVVAFQIVTAHHCVPSPHGRQRTHLWRHHHKDIIRSLCSSAFVCRLRGRGLLALAKCRKHLCHLGL